MTISQILQKSRRLAQVDERSFPNATLIPYINDIYHDLEEEIVHFNDEDFFYETRTSDIIKDQIEYELPYAGSALAFPYELKKIISV